MIARTSQLGVAQLGVAPFGVAMAARPEPPSPAFVLPFRGKRRAAPAPAGDAPLSPGEAERFRRLMLPHLDAVYSFSRFLCRDASLADDLTQDAFLRAYRGFGGFRGGEPRAWLFAIVRSSHMTLAQRRTEPSATPEVREAVPSPEDDAEAGLVRQGEAAALRTAIEGLPEPFRETLVLRELEELSYRQIAEITNAPIGTVMSRLARARTLLLAALRVEEMRP
jgi:RNA polymerase sigma-70 factor (ECF subfamily)